MPTVHEIASFLEEKVPSALKESYDNVGLLCGFPEQEVTKVLVVLDITLETIQEASALGAELIVAHHPLMNCRWHEVQSVVDEARKAGADYLVAGSYVLGSAHPDAAVASLQLPLSGNDSDAAV